MNSSKLPVLMLSRRAVAYAAALVLAFPVVAQEGGYFSGIRLGSGNKAWSFAAPGLKLGQALEFSRSGSSLERTNTAFGGYQFENGFAVGAALNSEPWIANVGNSGVGLKFDGLRWADHRPNVNVDVVSAFNWHSSLSVFGKLGVGRVDNRGVPDWSIGALGSQDRPAISYGVGVRYDLTPRFGLKLELSRGTRFGVDRLRTDSDVDAVNFGLRWTF